MKLNNELNLIHKNGYWVVEVLSIYQQGKKIGEQYTSGYKTFPTLEKLTLFLQDNNVEQSVIGQQSKAAYQEYINGVSKAYLAEKARRVAGKKENS